jgi:hypothetical protein
MSEKQSSESYKLLSDSINNWEESIKFLSRPRIAYLILRLFHNRMFNEETYKTPKTVLLI